MSLREELIKYLWKGCTYESAELQANGVIERIEKRIDSLQPNYDKIMSLDTSRGQVEYIEGFTDCMKIVKEMLNES